MNTPVITTLAIIQARMGSSRLPGKVLKPLGGKPTLHHIIKRLRQCPALDRIMVATTLQPQDDAIVRLCEQCDIPFYRGSEDDVLARYHAASRLFPAERIVRITADCPLVDPPLLTDMLAHFDRLTESGAAVDYLSNTLERRFPKGLDIEIFRKDALDTAQRQATSPYDREHVTPYLYRHPERFALANYGHEVDLSTHNWCLDTPEDYRFLCHIFDAWQTRAEPLHMQQLLHWLDNQTT